MIKDARILFINLSNQSYYVEYIDSEVYRKYPGGSALGMYLMLKMMDPKVDPLSPENMLIFSVSPLTGAPVSGLSRMCVTTKSPLTGTAGDSQVGGFIPAHLKGNGYDSVVFIGKAKKPIYVYINKDEIIFKDARNVWGKVTGESERTIMSELGENKVESSIIGPAGENMVPYASIMHMKNRANGRNGTGAVMGSKNLKAVVVKKQKLSSLNNELKPLTQNIKERIAANDDITDLGVYGTAGTLGYHADEGFLPSYNWNTGYFEEAENIGGAKINSSYLVKRDTCYGCAVRCKGAVEIEGRVDAEYGAPEYETCAAFGSYCGNTDLADICEANQLCNMYGLDTISCGATIAFAMECYENGILTKKDTYGLELKFGNGKVFKPLIKKIAYKEPGLGEILAQGSFMAAEIIGENSKDYVVTSKKQEWPAHMVQMKPNLAINYAVNNFGADHQSSEHDPALMAPKDNQNWIWPNMLTSFKECDSYGILDENKAKFAFETQKFYSMLDSLCLCQFVWGPAWQLYGPNDVVDLCRGSIGWNTTIEELQEIGERRINMMRIFNCLNGFDRSDDDLPKKAFIKIPDGPGVGHGISETDFNKALDSYYEFAGWDTDGIPTSDTLSRLGLDWVNLKQ